MAGTGGPAAFRRRAARMSTFQIAASLLLVVLALSASVLACEHHAMHGDSAQMLERHQQAQRRSLLAAEQDDTSKAAADIGVGAAARRLRSPVQSRRQQAAQKAADTAQQPTKSTIKDRKAGPWLTDDGAVRLPQKKPPPPLQTPPPPAAVPAPTASTPTSTPMPENAQPLARRTCAFEDDITVAENATAELAPRVAYLTSDLAPRGIVVNVNTYFHIIGDSEKAFTYVKQSMITNQIKALNDAYGMANFDFTLSGIDYTINKNWYPVDIYSPAFTDLKAAVHTGGAADLNIIVTMLNSGGVIGVATNPWGYGAGDLRYDGVTIDTGTLPGSWYSGYNLGRNAVHEVGHWMGLSHPFINGCTETNDGVSDTAQQAAADYACYSETAQLPNSCPNKPKSQPRHDPIRNYMGYAPDGCMWEFTTQQAARMTAAWQQYRQYAAGPVKPLQQTTGGGKTPTTKKPTTKKPTTKKPTTKKPTTKKSTTKKPTKKPTAKRPTKKLPKPFCYKGSRYVYSVARKKYVKSANKGSC